MGFNLSFGGTTFNLELSSSAIDTSLVSTKFIANTKSCDQRDRDAVIELHGFTGTLVIKHPKNENDDSSITKKIERDIDVSHTAENMAFHSHGEGVKNVRARAHGSKKQKATVQEIETDLNENNIDFYTVQRNKVSIKIDENEIKELEKNDEDPEPSKIASQKHRVSTLTEFSDSHSDHSGVYASTWDPELFNLDDDNKEINASDDDKKYDESVNFRASWISQATNTFSNNRRITRLHRACKSFTSKVPMLHKLLKQNPNDVSIMDLDGNLPLHLIAQNESLLFGKSAIRTKFFIEELIETYPDATLMSNDKGCLPFTTTIFDWIQNVHESVREEANYFDYEHEIIDIQLPNTVQVDPLVVKSFNYITDIITLLENTNLDIEKFNSNTRLNSPSAQFLSQVSLIPLLLKTCLLINKDKLRKRLFYHSFIKRCILMEHTVGEWLVVFLANSDTSSRAIEYFELLTKLTPYTAFGNGQDQVTDTTLFLEKREEVIMKISNMDNILPALFMLNDDDMKRACKTYPVRRILELSMSDPSLVGLLTVDLCMHLILIIAYDAQEGLLRHTTADDYMKVSFFNSPVMMTSMVCVYMFLREEVTYFMISKSFREVLKTYTSTIWNLIHLSAIIFIATTNIFILVDGQDTPFVFSFFSKSLIWIILLGFLKGTNLYLSMFVASLGRIVYSMRWFLVVMFMMIFLFADMLHLVIFNEFTEECNQVDFKNDHSLFSDYCSDVLLRSSLRSFSILAGDVGLDDYWELGSLKVVMLWVTYILLGVVMLLNVLIAIVTASYEKSNTHSHSILGIARIPILAKHSYLDTEAKKISELGAGNFRYQMTVAAMLTFIILFGISYGELVRVILGVTKGDEMTAATSDIMDVVKLLLLTIFYIVANVAMVVTMKDWLHIDIKMECPGEETVKLIVKPVTTFIFNLLGVTDNEYHEINEEDFEQSTLLPEVRRIVDASLDRVRFDLNKLSMRLKKESNRRRSISSMSDISEIN